MLKVWASTSKQGGGGVGMGGGQRLCDWCGVYSVAASWLLYKTINGTVSLADWPREEWTVVLTVTLERRPR